MIKITPPYAVQPLADKGEGLGRFVERSRFDDYLGNSILSLLIFFPILGAAVLLFINKENRTAIRWVALLFAFVEFIFSLPLFFAFDSKTAAMQFLEDYWWVQSYGISYKLGIDGISLFWFS